MDAEHLYETQNAAYFSRLKAQFNWALTLMMAFSVLLGAVYFAQESLFETARFAIAPQSLPGLVGVLSAPLLHGSFEHLASNVFAFLIIGTLALTLYPRASMVSWPIIWLGSGLGTWFISLGGHHIGASGITVGLMFFLIGQGLRRRDRSSLVGLMLALFFFGGMLLSVLPQQQGISWEYHLSGAVFGVLCGLFLASKDERAPKKLYSWDLEEAEPETADDELTLPPPESVPVLWNRPESDRQAAVLPFKRREP